MFGGHGRCIQSGDDSLVAAKRVQNFADQISICEQAGFPFPHSCFALIEPPFYSRLVCLVDKVKHEGGQLFF